MNTFIRLLGILSFACGLLAFFFLLFTQPLLGFSFGLLGIALGFALYWIGTARKRPEQKEACSRNKKNASPADSLLHR